MFEAPNLLGFVLPRATRVMAYTTRKVKGRWEEITEPAALDIDS
jgi:hypothetical protein